MISFPVSPLFENNGNIYINKFNLKLKGVSEFNFPIWILPFPCD